MDRRFTIPEHYEALEVLARGPISTLVRARHIDSGDAVALKAYHVPAWMTAAEGADHLAGIAGIAGEQIGFEHPNVAPIREVIDQDSALFVAREYVEGASLAEHVGRFGLLEAGEVRRIAGEAAAALDALRASGIAHRGINAHNIILACDGTVRLTDAGIAASATTFRIAGISSRFSAQTGTDIHLLAAVLYEAMTGWRPSDRRVLEFTSLALTKPVRHAFLSALRSERPSYRSATAFAASLEPLRNADLLQLVWRPAAAVGLLSSLVTVGGNAVSESRDVSHPSSGHAVHASLRRAAPAAPFRFDNLAPADRETLRQVVQHYGVASLSQPAVAQCFDLGDVQRGIIDDCLIRYKEHVNVVVDATTDGLKVDSGTAMAQLRHQTEARVLFLLTPQQRSWWDSLHATQ